jgi:cytochrome P450
VASGITSLVSTLRETRRVVRVIRATIRNPLDALPVAAYEQPILRSTMLKRALIHVMDPVLIHEVLVTHANRVDKGRAVRRALSPALGDGLLTAEGSSWRWQRQAIAPLFRPDRVQVFAGPMIAAAEACRDRLRALGPDRTVAIERETARTTFDVIVNTMLSDARFDADEMIKGVSNYVRQTNWSLASNLLGAPQWLPHPGKKRAEKSNAVMRRQIGDHVSERRARGAHGDRPDLLDHLLSARDPETGRAMTDVEITDNLLTFLAAGHETTALGLAWTLDLIGRNPEIGVRARDEILRVTEGGPVEAHHIAKLGYIRQIFNEAMRLYPPAPMISRQAYEGFVLDGVAVAPGTTLVIPIGIVHRHQGLWTDPDRFDPDRFSPEAEKARHRYAFMPFGAGPRVCIGNIFALTEAVAILAVLLRDLDFTPALAEPPRARMDITLRPESPLLMQVSSRRLH